MGALFVNASSTSVINTSPVLVSTGYPWTCACWFFPITVGTSRSIFGFSNNTVASANPTFQELFISSGGALTNTSDSAGSASAATSALALTAGTWNFAICRNITTTNRWISHLNSAGATSHVQSVVSSGPTGMNQMNIGTDGASTLGRFFDGIIAEVWYCDADIQRGKTAATALDDNLFRKLAYEGPFSFPDIRANIVEYRSLRQTIASSPEQADENYSRVGRQTWTASATAPTNASPHPPLSSRYITPYDHQTNLVF